MVGPSAEEEVSAGQRCAQCGGSTHLRTPHVSISGGVGRAFCSAQCAAGVAPLVRSPLAPPPRRLMRVARFVMALPLLAFTSGRAPPVDATRADVVAEPTAAAAAATARSVPD